MKIKTVGINTDDKFYTVVQKMDKDSAREYKHSICEDISPFAKGESCSLDKGVAEVAQGAIIDFLVDEQALQTKEESIDAWLSQLERQAKQTWLSYLF